MSSYSVVGDVEGFPANAPLTSPPPLGQRDGSDKQKADDREKHKLTHAGIICGTEVMI